VPATEVPLITEIHRSGQKGVAKETNARPKGRFSP
jgi:hypothetical protein